MIRFGPIAAFLLLVGCNGLDENRAAAPIGNGASDAAVDGRGNVVDRRAGARWDLQSSGEGTALVYLAESGGAAIRLFCPARQNRLLVNVPAFRAIASEERLTFGSGSHAVTLVADSAGDRARGGVSGAGEIPDTLKPIVEGRVAASYGAQRSGPHPSPPEPLSRDFVIACNDGAAAARQAASRPGASTSPCLVQDGELLRLTPLRAIGTEPFWGARIEGRCVTYSHPEDQAGTRIWTRFTPGPDGGIWVGAFGGRRFELRTRSAPGCSDGMSDNRYPIAVELFVNGERRRGCAQRL